MYGYGYRYNSGLVVSAGGGAPFVNTKSLSFDGADDYVYCGSASYLNGLTEFSVSAWFNLTTAANNKCILSDWNYNSSPFGHFSITTTNTLGGDFRLVFFIKAASDPGSNYIKTQSTVCTEATWYNITATYNAGVCKIYVNGIEAPIFIFGTIPTALTTQDGNLNIGRFPGIGYNWDGNIDEAAVFDYALTQQNVTDIYNLGTPNDLSLLATPPLHWYRNGDNGAWKSPQWLIPNNENKDKVSNYSFDFDGVDDYVDLGDSFNSVFIGTAWSFSAWIKVSANTSYDCFFSKGYSLQFYIHLNKVKIYLGYPYLTNIKPLVSAATILVDTWYHIAFTRSGNDNVLYINGSSDSTATSVGSISTSTTESIIGAYTNTASYPFQGNIDEAAVFDYALTQQNITDIYNSGTPNDITSLTPSGYWRMGENATFLTNWTVPDSVGTNDGTSANMTIEDRVGEAPNSSNNALSFNMDEVDRVTDVPT